MPEPPLTLNDPGRRSIQHWIPHGQGFRQDGPNTVSLRTGNPHMTLIQWHKNSIVRFVGNWPHALLKE